MSWPYAQILTAVTGNVLAASDWNNEQQNHINNNIPTSINSFSANVAGMQVTVDPYPGSVESLATDLGGELSRLRYIQQATHGETQWYNHPGTTLKSVVTYVTALLRYRRSGLVWRSVTQVDIEANTGTLNETAVLFPDGTMLKVTENVPSSHKYRIFDITTTANFISGTESGGLYTGLSEATNTWYAIYAVKSQINAANFVLVGTTTLPVQANYATLNTNFGTNSWVYIGMIRNGDNSGTTGDILKFVQSGAITTFENTLVTTGNTMTGTRLATTSGATNVSYTYSSGTGTANIPDTILQVCFGWSCAAGGTGVDIHQQAVSTLRYIRMPSLSVSTGSFILPYVCAAGGLSVDTGSSTAQDIILVGFIDSVLCNSSLQQIV